MEQSLINVTWALVIATAGLASFTAVLALIVTGHDHSPPGARSFPQGRAIAIPQPGLQELPTPQTQTPA